MNDAPLWTGRMNANLEHRKGQIWTLAIVGAAAGGLLYWLVKSHIESYGYRFNG